MLFLILVTDFHILNSSSRIQKQTKLKEWCLAYLKLFKVILFFEKFNFILKISKILIVVFIPFCSIKTRSKK